MLKGTTCSARRQTRALWCTSFTATTWPSVKSSRNFRLYPCSIAERHLLIYVPSVHLSNCDRSGVDSTA
jgi:hypothetical protein